MKKVKEQKEEKVKVELTRNYYLFIKDSSHKVYSEFMQWALDNKVYALRLGGHSGAGSYGAFFSHENAIKIKKYFKGKLTIYY